MEAPGAHPLSDRYTDLSDRFRSLWTFYQFLGGVFKHRGNGEFPYSYDFQGLYRQLQELVPRISRDDAGDLEHELDHVDRELGRIRIELAKIERDFAPSIAAAGGIGVAQACLDETIKYCKERKQFGKLIGEFQMNQDLIAQMSAELEAARLVVYKAAWAKDEGRLNNGLDVAQAKYLAGEVAHKCANYAMRILGAYGYSTEYPVARFYRDAPTYTMVEGSANICKWIIALDQLGIRKANR